MPWQASEAKSHSKKADTPALQRKWAKVANAALKTYAGEEDAEAKAIRTANAAMGDARYRTERRDPLGKLISTEETEEEDVMPLDFQILGDAEPDIFRDVAMRDAIELDDEAKVKFIDGGYMSAFPRIARTGIQLYKGKECGKVDMDTVRVYRPAEEVFHKDAIHSYTHLPVTNDHPGVMVDAKNWHKYAKGDTGDEVLRDGNSVRVPMMLRDHDTIQAYKKDGKNQLSVGYNCDLEWTSGKTADGEEYDAIQHNIRANHLAVVTAARGGETLKLGDGDARDSKGDDSMTAVTKLVVIDGVQVEMSDTAAQVVQRAMQNLKDMADEFKKKAAESKENEEESKEDGVKKDGVIRTKDAEIATLKQQLKDAEITPIKLDALVKDRQIVIDKARSILGKNLITDSRTVDDIRKQVVDAKLGAAANGWQPDQIKASFDTLVSEFKSDPITDATYAFSRPHFSNVDPRDAAYADYDKQAANAWKLEGKTN